MALETGRYIMKSGDYYVGRPFVEDRSLLPKRVCLLPSSIDIIDAPRWLVEATGDGYRLNALGAPTGVVHGKVVAFLMEKEMEKQWELHPVEGRGHGFYTIHAREDPENAAWISPSEVEGQIKCGILTGSANNIFEFILADYE